MPQLFARLIGIVLLAFAAEGVRHFLIDAPGKVVAELAAATRGRELLLFNVSAPDDALRQAQCQAHLYHTIPNHGMQTDALAQFLVAKKGVGALKRHPQIDLGFSAA